MFQRRSFHECATELAMISSEFRLAYQNPAHRDRDRILRETSVAGVQILRVLASSIRAEQDYGILVANVTAVGAFKDGVASTEIANLIGSYRPPYRKLADFAPLGLRPALNKIIHANPGGAGFFADPGNHDLILTGTHHRRDWIAVISLLDLCDVIQSLPNSPTNLISPANLNPREPR